MDRTVLVTGGAGFIGSAVVRMLIRTTSARVVVVDKLTYAGNRESLAEVAEHPRFSFERIDVGDGARLRSTFDRYQPAAVLHLAAESHVDRSIDAPAPFLETNVVGTFTLLNEALRYYERAAAADFRFVHVSTDEVFGSLGEAGRFDATAPYDPSSPYAASKAAADHFARAWQRTYGLPIIVTNSCNNYGPYQFPEKLIPLAILKAISGQPIPVYGKGLNVRDWLYVDDHARALLTVLEQGEIGTTYMVGANQERRNIDVVNAICTLLDELRPAGRPHARLIEHTQDRPGHDFRYAVAAAATRQLGWQPLESFESGLHKTVQWYLANEQWWQRVQSGAYRGERLGTGAR